MNPSVDDKRLVIEIIASLVHIKKTMASLILQPAGVPSDIYLPLLYKKDDVTGRTFSKRDIAPLILNNLENRSDFSEIVRTIIEIAAGWSSFHLADDEFQARATVQKARESLHTIEIMEAREAKERDQARKQEIARFEKEKADIFKKQTDLLLMMFDEMARSSDPHGRGYLLQDLMNRTWDIFEIPVVKSYTRNSGGEQIDGAFRFDGWYYIVECRWRKKLSDIRDLDGLKGQVDRSGKQTMGVFLSIEGWSDNVPGLLKQNPDKSIILMDGYDLRCTLTSQIDLTDFIVSKLSHLNLRSEPFYGATQYLEENKH